MVAGVSALLFLGTAGPAVGAPAADDANSGEAFAAGAAATGDGSAIVLEELVEQDAPDLSVSSSVLWWSGGGLGLLLAGAVAARRPSPRR